VTVDANSDIYINNKHFIGTPGLWELLTRESVIKELVNTDDLMQYKSILNLTSAQLEEYKPHAPIHVLRGIDSGPLSKSCFLKHNVALLKLHCVKSGRDISDATQTVLRLFKGLEFCDSAETTERCTKTRTCRYQGLVVKKGCVHIT
jgi:hypothetical protein